jgi:serine/threonine protein phosphatase PrpC
MHRPQFGEIDSWGLTHPGKERATNQDHYFMGGLMSGVKVISSSLGHEAEEVAFPVRSATIAVVADGVGSSYGGEHAAQVAVDALVREVARSFHHAEVVEATDPDVFSRLLQDAALACHASLLGRAEQEPGKGSFSTTLTLFLGLWPHAYILQVGDSRAYIYQHDKLTQVTRDQTWAQELIDQGTLSQTKAEASRWANVLSSSIGGQETTPVVTRIERDWGAILLCCSDGLTKHVSNERISELAARMTSARQLAEDLLQEALDGGGSDNITIIAGRTIPREDE